MSENYYEILGVNKNASKEEIKRAYWRLAQKYHPDKPGGEAEKFKKINEVYQVLSDDEKRAQYDQYGKTFEGMQAEGGYSGFEGFRDFASFMEAMRDRGTETIDFSDLGSIFEDFFGFTSPFKARKRKERIDKEIEVLIDFRDSIFGTEKEVQIEHFVLCETCRGQGFEPGSKLITCSHCKGRGVITRIEQTFFGSFRSETICPHCGGQGRIPEKKCRDCDGEGRIKKKESLKIKIPAGIKDGEALKIVGEGDVIQHSKESGHLYLRIKVKPLKEFRRVDDNIYTEEEISLSLAVLGGKVKVKTLEGDVWLKIPAATSSGQEFRLKGKGVHFRAFSRGDQIVRIKVKMPKSLTPKQRKLLEELKKEGL